MAGREAVVKAIDKLADAFVKAAPETRQAMSWTEKVCASLAIVASHGAECRVPYDGSDALYVRGLRLSDEERAAMADAGWTEGGEGFWRL